MKLNFTLLLALFFSFSFAQVTLTSSNLPIIKINTNNVAIPDEPKIDGSMEIIYNSGGVRNNVTDAANEYNGKIGIEVRGESSQMFPMKSYSVELRDANGKDIDQSIFGLQAESDWVLYAPYSDKTFMRNVLAYNMSNQMGHWAPHTKFVEVILNGNYIGVYVFLERIKRKRVGLKKLEGADSTGYKVTGGYIFAIDKDADAWTSPYTTPNSNKSIRFKYVYPKVTDILDTQRHYIEKYVDSFETSLAANNFADLVNGYRKFADEPSFIDFLLVNEVSRNVDGYRISTYLNKDRDDVNKKIKAGPVWDYDIAFRNANYCNGSDTTGWAYNFNNVCAGDGMQVPFWWQRFMQDPAFQSDMLCRWLVLRQTTLSETYLNAFIDSAAAVVNEAKQRHFTKWPVLGIYVWPNPQPIPTTYAGEISSLKIWLSNRLAWIDRNIAKVGQCASTLAVNVTNLKVVRNTGNATLSWQTTAEINSDRFVIERSFNGTSFTAFAELKARGNSNTTIDYTITDANIDRYPVQKIFYRLQSIDKAGDVKTSNIVFITTIKGPLYIMIYPNPVKELVKVQVQSAKNQLIKLVITNAMGQQMIAIEQRIVTGINQLSYTAAEWPKGMYLITAVADDGSATMSRFIK